MQLVVKDTRDAKEMIEKLIDIYGVTRFMELTICVVEDKADHIRSNWQDAHLADKWTKFALRCDKLVTWCRKIGPQ